MAQVIADTGPLLAYFDRRAEHHAWTRRQFEVLSEPLVTCEAVITEVLFLLKRDGLQPDWVLDLMERGALLCAFDLASEIIPVRKLLRQYRDLPATLADVCLVRMSERERHSIILTLDRDFLIYRRNGRQKIPLLSAFTT